MSILAAVTAIFVYGMIAAILGQSRPASPSVFI
jgi:hypothetical protein